MDQLSISFEEWIKEMNEYLQTKQTDENTKKLLEKLENFHEQCDQTLLKIQKMKKLINQ